MLVDVNNMIVQLLKTMGCDLSYIPTNEFEMHVQTLLFLAAILTIIFFLYFIAKIICALLGVGRLFK